MIIDIRSKDGLHSARVKDSLENRNTMYYNPSMKVIYSKQVAKRVQKHKLPKEIWKDFKDAFESLAHTQNFRLFDIKRLVAKGPYTYYRLRIRSYHALFHFDHKYIYVEDIAPRGEVYRS